MWPNAEDFLGPCAMGNVDAKRPRTTGHDVLTESPSVQKARSIAGRPHEPMGSIWTTDAAFRLVDTVAQQWTVYDDVTPRQCAIVYYCFYCDNLG